jgi:hypothetical protein
MIRSFRGLVLVGNDLHHLDGTNDETVRRRSDVGKRITGHERQDRVSRGVEHPDVPRVDHERPLDPVDVRAFRRDEPDLVLRLDLLEAAEEGIAVPGEADVAFGAGQSRAGDVADGEAERPGITAGADDRGHAQPRDLEPSQRGPAR